MRLGKALATGIAEEDPRTRPRQEALEVPAALGALEREVPEPEPAPFAPELTAGAPADR
jgi:hypothetical protein